MIKRCLLIIIGLIGLSTQGIKAQATVTLSCDTINALSPLIMNDTTDFLVRVRVDDAGSPDTITGDLFYYFLTDSMMNAGDTARVINSVVITEMVYDGMFDTVSVDIQPDEIRTSPPMNLIVIWPAMIDPTILDLDSIEILLPLAGFHGIDFPPDKPRGNLVFPSPAMNFLYIHPDQIDQVAEMIIHNMLGETVAVIPHAGLSSGWIHIDLLQPGSYIATLYYMNGTSAQMKFMKQ